MQPYFTGAVPLLSFDWRTAVDIFHKETGKDQIMIAGIDEVGRGALAGPVVCGCVHFPAFIIPSPAQTLYRARLCAAIPRLCAAIPRLCAANIARKKQQEEEFWSKINDSKRLSPKERAIIYEQIKSYAQWGIGAVTAAQIDKIGIVAATRRAAQRAYCALEMPVDLLLLDRGIVETSASSTNFTNLCSTQNKEEAVPINHRASVVIRSLTRGDSCSLHIAAASILAKVFRDRLMVHFDRVFPQYEFAAHKGYPTVAHRRAITRYGLSSLHRHTFARNHNT